MTYSDINFDITITFCIGDGDRLVGDDSYLMTIIKHVFDLILNIFHLML